MKSIWQNEIEKPNFKTLEDDISTDILIIGGGLTGILCGYMLKNAGVDYLIVEAKEILDGVTKNTTAKVTIHHGAIFDKMIKCYGEEKAKLYLKANQEALEKYRMLSKKIDCDFKETVSYVYSRNNREKIEKEVLALNRLGYVAKFQDQTELPFSIAGAVELSDQAQFHPLKFAYAVAKDLKISEHTEVTAIQNGYAITNRGRIKAKKIIAATHFPFLNKHGLYFLKMYQHRSYVLALKNAPLFQGIYVDEAQMGLSFRSYNDMLLLGGGGHRTGKQGGCWQELRAVVSQYYPHAREVCHYAAQDCMTLDDIPYIGKYSVNTPSLYVATGYNKWGMTTAMTAAQVLTDLVQEKHSEYAALYNPSRSIWHKQLWINAGESALGLITPTAPRCSHLGCSLKYNKQEHSWDCGCHGSRFSEDGQVIDNPALKNISAPRKAKK